MVHVQQMEENKNKKHTRARNRSRQAEKNFWRESSTEIRDKTRFMKGLSHQGESSLSKDRYDRVPRQELRVGSVSNFMEESVWGDLMLVRFVTNQVTWWRIVQIGEVKNKGRRDFSLMVQVKSLQGGNESSHSSLRVQEKAPLVKYQVRSLN